MSILSTDKTAEPQRAVVKHVTLDRIKIPDSTQNTRDSSNKASTGFKVRTFVSESANSPSYGIHIFVHGTDVHHALVGCPFSSCRSSITYVFMFLSQQSMADKGCAYVYLLFTPTYLKGRRMSVLKGNFTFLESQICKILFRIPFL